MRAIWLGAIILVSVAQLGYARDDRYYNRNNVRDGRYTEGYPGDYRDRGRSIGDGRYSDGYPGDYRDNGDSVGDGRYLEGYPGDYRRS